MERENSFMRTKPVFPLLVSMSVPMMLSMLIQSLYNIVDSIYVSRLGTDALTAVSFIGVTTFVISAIGVKIGNVFGTKYKSKAEFAGGAILILLGVKILLEHLGIL